ncbi:PBP1A family penicillin-binding protein [Porticoccaceae bacterium LTM1]|nr:PBP1A family penicillin-binding protein [Porticoccaceae bacterium LTM1]
MFDQIPDQFIKAILSAEDDRFYEHQGVDLKGLLRAFVQLLGSGEIRGGGSTITMQVARNFFLNSEQTFTRKFNEILLSWRIEEELTKNEILTLYANKIYLGNRAYGIEAAAQAYYGKKISELNLAQLAMIAGLPKAPSKYNPIARPERSKIRRDWILSRMLELGHITEDQFQEAVAQPVTAKRHGFQTELEAHYVAEMARQKALELGIEDLNSDGYRIYTTIDSRLQQSANYAVREGLFEYEWRHGYRGAERHIANPEDWEQVLGDTPSYAELIPGIVTEMNEEQVTVGLRGGEKAQLVWKDQLENIKRTNGRTAKELSELLKVGDLIRLKADQQPGGSTQWSLSQVPAAQAGLVALDPQNGAIRSMMGGFDYFYSKFNRMVQGERQPGSNFKPFIYAGALEAGMTAATPISGASITMAEEEGFWRPENDSGQVFGMTPLRKGLYKSMNTVSVRLLRSIGIEKGINSAARFGFDPNQLPRNYTLALGSQAVHPIKVATGYAAFANGGYLVEPYLVERIEDVYGKVIYQANPKTVPGSITPKPDLNLNLASLEEELNDVTTVELELTQDTTAQGDSTELALEEATQAEEPAQEADLTAEPVSLPEAPRVLEPRVAYIMDSILKDVIKKGTATRVWRGTRGRGLKLERADIAGKTGTTNEARDAWFSGYSPHIVTTVWVGFDDNRPLGRGEYGGTAALPIWIDFMKTALDGIPEQMPRQPDGLVTVLVDPDTGERVGPDRTDAIYEVFLEENVPPAPADNGKQSGENGKLDDLF